MSAGKPQGPNVVGMNSINIAEKSPHTLEEMFVELMDYTDFLEPVMFRLANEFSIEEELEEEEHKIESSEKSLEKSIPTTSNEKQVEEIKMLSEVHDPLINLEKCSLHELINVLQKFASDPSCNVHQAGFGSYIANHVLKEKIARYNNEAMIPPKLGDAWLPRF